MFSPSISELVHILEINGLIPRGGERRSRQSADIITRIGSKVDRGERLTPIEFEEGDYPIAIAWFDSILPDIEEAIEEE